MDVLEIYVTYNDIFWLVPYNSYKGYKCSFCSSDHIQLLG